MNKLLKILTIFLCIFFTNSFANCPDPQTIVFRNGNWLAPNGWNVLGPPFHAGGSLTFAGAKYGSNPFRHFRGGHIWTCDYYIEGNKNRMLQLKPPTPYANIADTGHWIASGSDNAPRIEYTCTGPDVSMCQFELTEQY